MEVLDTEALSLQFWTSDEVGFLLIEKKPSWDLYPSISSDMTEDSDACRARNTVYYLYSGTISTDVQVQLVFGGV